MQNAGDPDARHNHSGDVKHRRTNAEKPRVILLHIVGNAGLPDLFEQTPNICVMRAATPVCKVPKKSGSGYKFPKLAEACGHFKIAQQAQHTAMDDARVAAQIMRELAALGALPEPEVHFAKEKPAPSTPVLPV